MYPRHDHPHPEPLGLAAARRARVVAQLALVAWLAYGANACEVVHGHQGKLPDIIPADFKARLTALIAAGKHEDATRYLRQTDPTELARAASMRGDIRYFVIMGVGPTLPGIDPKPEPSRKWTVPGTSDMTSSKEEQVYNAVAYDFAKAYNAALAKLEGRVK